MFLSFVLFSCSQDEEVYSCNQEVNDWVKQHKSYIQSLNRSQWHELNISVAKPSYSAFTPSQKIAFWKDKFDEVLQGLMADNMFAKVYRFFVDGNQAHMSTVLISSKKKDE